MCLGGRIRLYEKSSSGWDSVATPDVDMGDFTHLGERIDIDGDLLVITARAIALIQTPRVYVLHRDQRGEWKLVSQFNFGWYIYGVHVAGNVFSLTADVDAFGKKRIQLYKYDVVNNAVGPTQEVQSKLGAPTATALSENYLVYVARVNAAVRSDVIIYHHESRNQPYREITQLDPVFGTISLALDDKILVVGKAGSKEADIYTLGTEVIPMNDPIIVTFDHAVSIFHISDLNVIANGGQTASYLNITDCP